MKIFIFAVLTTVALCQNIDDFSTNGTTPDANSTSVQPSSTPAVTTVPTTNVTDSGNSTQPSTTVPPTTNVTDSGNSTQPSTTVPSTNGTTPLTTAPAKTTPSPPVETVNATVKNGTDGNVCISMTAQMSLMINDGNSTRYVVVPKDAKPSGNCSLNATTQSLELSFDKDWNLKFTFSKDENSDVTISQIEVNYEDSSALEAMKTATVSGSFFKSGADGNYYLCNSNTTLLGTDAVTLTASNLKYKAFNGDTSALFTKTATECAADEDTSSVVPIAVGAALAGLVIIVLIAYLIGRRKSRQLGYESV